MTALCRGCRKCPLWHLSGICFNKTSVGRAQRIYALPCSITFGKRSSCNWCTTPLEQFYWVTDIFYKQIKPPVRWHSTRVVRAKGINTWNEESTSGGVCTSQQCPGCCDLCYSMGKANPPRGDVSIHLAQVTSDARSSLGFACVNLPAPIYSLSIPITMLSRKSSIWKIQRYYKINPLGQNCPSRSFLFECWGRSPPVSTTEHTLAPWVSISSVISNPTISRSVWQYFL